MTQTHREAALTHTAECERRGGAYITTYSTRWLSAEDVDGWMREGHSVVSAGEAQAMIRVERDECIRKSDNADRFQQ